MSDPGRRLRVYMVEDSAILRNRLFELLDAIGVEVVGYSDRAAAAIREIGAVNPDVVIADVALRQGSGFDVLRALDLATDGPHPTMIVLSNYDMRPYRDTAQKLGATYYFQKSSGVSAMLQVLSSMARDISLRNGSEH